MNNVIACFRKCKVCKVTKDFGIGFPCQLAHLGARKGVKELSVNVEGFVIDIYCHFLRCAKCKNHLREFMNFTSSEVRKAINHISTRWLSLEKCLMRNLMQWDSLEPYVLSNSNLDDDSTRNNSDKKPSREKRLVNAFKQAVFYVRPVCNSSTW